jgi:hypothetical protein
MKIRAAFDRLSVGGSGEIDEPVETLNRRVFRPWFEELKRLVPTGK